jgi:Ner family transcriptional regulator
MSPDKPTQWHPEDVKAAVRKTGSTMMEVALAAGLHRTAVSNCLRWPIPAANRAIAAHLGLPVGEIWPDWYGADGELLPSYVERRQKLAARHRQKEAAQ